MSGNFSEQLSVKKIATTSDDSLPGNYSGRRDWVASRNNLLLGAGTQESKQQEFKKVKEGK